MPVTVPASGVRAGTVAYFAAGTPPVGWLECNGAAVSRTLYAALFLALGTTYGAGDGSTTFNLPELRGEFLRCADSGRGVDSGRSLGTAQGGQNASHAHTASTASGGGHAHTASTASAGLHRHQIGSVQNSGAWSSISQTQTTDGNSWPLGTEAGAHTHSVTVDAAAAHSHGVTVDAAGGTEARPRNVALLACIKF